MDGKIDSMLPDGFVEALWETMVALAMTAGVCVGIISLAAHLNETRAARSASEPSVAVSAPTAGLEGALSTSNLN